MRNSCCGSASSWEGNNCPRWWSLCFAISRHASARKYYEPREACVCMCACVCKYIYLPAHALQFSQLLRLNYQAHARSYKRPSEYYRKWRSRRKTPASNVRAPQCLSNGVGKKTISNSLRKSATAKANTRVWKKHSILYFYSQCTNTWREPIGAIICLNKVRANGTRLQQLHNVSVLLWTFSF